MLLLFLFIILPTFSCIEYLYAPSTLKCLIFFTNSTHFPICLSVLVPIAPVTDNHKLVV